MPLTEADQRRVEEAEAEAEASSSTKLLVRSPSDAQKLGSITVMCLILNRTIGKLDTPSTVKESSPLTAHKGSGIYVTPAIVLQATNSIGISLLLWTLGAIFGMCDLLVWLELGLSIPKFQNPEPATGAPLDGEGAFDNVPRSGGEKNYVKHSGAV